MKRYATMLSLLALGALVSQGCERFSNPVDTAAPGEPAAMTEALAKKSGSAPPSPLVSFAGASFWPYTGTSFSGSPSDPINLIFKGQDDPRQLRSALMSLDGDRTAFGLPDVFPFNATWSDAIGGVQTTYGGSNGWVGNAVQLELGDYESVRFHVRFFDVGDYTLGAAHLDLLIPGTTDHVVISWEVAEQLLMVDFIRLGAAVSTTGVINDTPYFREIPEVIYNGMPVELKALIGGPLGTVTNPVPVPTNGKATVLDLSYSPAGSPGTNKQDFVIQFNQTIPKPFCASGEFDYIHVTGPVTLRQQVIETGSGNLISQFHAKGHLNITTLPSGETYKAVVNEHHKGIVTDKVTMASSFQLQILMPKGPARGRLQINLNVGPGDSNHYSMKVDCEP